MLYNQSITQSREIRRLFPSLRAERSDTCFHHSEQRDQTLVSITQSREIRHLQTLPIHHSEQRDHAPSSSGRAAARNTRSPGGSGPSQPGGFKKEAQGGSREPPEPPPICCSPPGRPRGRPSAPAARARSAGSRSRSGTSPAARRAARSAAADGMRGKH
jgi:hypothetical protein